MEAPSQSETCLAFVKTVNYISVMCNLTPLGTGPNPFLYSLQRGPVMLNVFPLLSIIHTSVLPFDQSSTRLTDKHSTYVSLWGIHNPVLQKLSSPFYRRVNCGKRLMKFSPNHTSFKESEPTSKFRSAVSRICICD